MSIFIFLTQKHKSPFMKKSSKLLLSLAALVLFFTGCKKDDPGPEITITTSNFTVGAVENREAKAVFEINEDWTATIGYEGSDKNWLTIAPTSGSAGKDQEIVMTAEVNTTAAERIAYVTISYANKTHKLTVTQTAGPDDITAFFDLQFAAVLEKRGYIPDAANIKIADVKDITKLAINSSELTSLKGIEYFAVLSVLSCANNQLSALDLSKNTVLSELTCSYNQLTALDISKNTALAMLVCSNNPLTALDVSKNTALTHLWCDENQLTTLDLSKNTALTWLSCAQNQLTTLDVTHNTALKELHCFFNQLTELDVSKHTELTKLDCFHNQLTTLDISQNTKLIEFLCIGNLGVSNVFVVKAWFDNTNIPDSFTTGNWGYNGQSITIDYQKVTK